MENLNEYEEDTDVPVDEDTELWPTYSEEHYRLLDACNTHIQELQRALEKRHYLPPHTFTLVDPQQRTLISHMITRLRCDLDTLKDAERVHGNTGVLPPFTATAPSLEEVALAESMPDFKPLSWNWLEDPDKIYWP